MKKLLCTLFISVLAVTFMGVIAAAQDSSVAKKTEKTTIKIGTFSTARISAEAGVEPLKAMGYDVEVIYFDDAVLPNTALQEGSIDCNIYQHKPYLDAFMKDNSGKALCMPQMLYYPSYGLYSKRYKSIEEIPNGAHIGLYSDASNVDRGLRLLNACGLIKLTDEKKEFYSELDIADNPKNLTFELVAFGSGVSAMEDLDACVAVGSHILDGGMDPRGALALEKRGSTGSDFTCGIAVRTEDLNTVWLKDVIAAYTSAESRDYMNEHYKGASVPVF